MNAHPFDVLTLPDHGCLIFTPCPGTKGVDLATSVSELQQAGAEAIVTMMPEDELARFEVSKLPEVVRQRGMAWFHFPVEDDAAPGEAFETAWQANKAELLSLAQAGKCVAIHCRGGSGRTGFMAVVLLRQMGMGLQQATGLVKGLRPNSLKLAAHTDYLATL